MADAGTDNLREYAPEGVRGDGQSRRAGERHVNYAIRQDSIGYRLLKKAGWKENAGLGAHGQVCNIVRVTGQLSPRELLFVVQSRVMP
jgi:hypothetical protein